MRACVRACVREGDFGADSSTRCHVFPPPSFHPLPCREIMASNSRACKVDLRDVIVDSPKVRSRKGLLTATKLCIKAFGERVRVCICMYVVMVRMQTCASGSWPNCVQTCNCTTMLSQSYRCSNMAGNACVWQPHHSHTNMTIYYEGLPPAGLNEAYTYADGSCLISRGWYKWRLVHIFDIQ